jgi:hypothetical protein
MGCRRGFFHFFERGLRVVIHQPPTPQDREIVIPGVAAASTTRIVRIAPMQWVPVRDCIISAWAGYCRWVSAKVLLTLPRCDVNLRPLVPQVLLKRLTGRSRIYDQNQRDAGKLQALSKPSRDS